jgi:hypothetical protein
MAICVTGMAAAPRREIVSPVQTAAMAARLATLGHGQDARATLRR